MAQSLFSRVVVPVANEDDAAATVEALLRYGDGTPRAVIAVHVIEKAGGAPDKASVEQRELAAKEMFQIVREQLQGNDIVFQTEFLYGTDVGDAIIEAAHDFNASAIVFTPRGGSRWLKLLTGDVTTTLVNESDVPVLVLPDQSDELSG
ncbi:universal stress protein [Halorhabdus rudnickae]|uniref:universal stress protein n=1 Tax=Halorhabdus rudnickae TaxID=1775544 RepID=UPI0010827381|nr:universal stress protein [Halorhabdus rudnickae]